MNNKIAFIGHRYVFDKSIKSKLYYEVKRQIENGCTNFTMGMHGEFDKLALDICRDLKKIYNEIKIEVVITSLYQVNHFIEFEGNKNFNDITTVMYDIEEEHFKRKIVSSNMQMINGCDTLICYVDTFRNYGGAIIAYKYAKKKGLDIVNLFS